MAHIFGTARYDGNTWKDMWGIPMRGQLMTRYKDKVIVYAKTGNFREIYAFDSTGVNDIGSPNGGIGAMEVYNGELYVAGEFSKIDNQKFHNIARWNGTSWNDVGGGVTGIPSFAGALIVFNGKLYVGGGLILLAVSLHGILQFGMGSIGLM